MRASPVARTPTAETADGLRGRNFLHLYGDAFWAGIGYGSVLTFASVYAARLGAVEWQLGLLSAMPPLTILLLAAPAARWLEGRPLIRTLAGTFFVQRLMYLALIPLPWLFASPGQIGAILLIHFAVALTSAVGHVAWGTMLGAVIPPEWRGRILGRRGAIIALNAALTLLACGRLLTDARFPLNYQIVFGVGALSMLMTSVHISRLRVAPGPLAAPAEAAPKNGLRHPLWRLDLARGPFGRLLGAYFLFYAFQAFTIPLYPLLYVREMRLADQWVSTATMLNYATVLVTSLLLGQLSARAGRRAVLVSAAALFSLSPLLMAGAQSADGLFWMGALLNGLGTTLAWTILVDGLLERIPADDRPGHIALHAITWQLAWLAGSAQGPALSAGLGLRPALACASAGLVLAAGLLWRWA
jgi:Na+/melibiose symporter-like transporter